MLFAWLVAFVLLIVLLVLLLLLRLGGCCCCGVELDADAWTDDDVNYYCGVCDELAIAS